MYPPTATNAQQLRSVGCVRLEDKPSVRVIERYNQDVKVTITTQSSIVPFWVSSLSLDCSPRSAGTSMPQPRSPYEQTSDGFVWKEGKRIGWVDDNTSTFYRADQIEVAGSARPTVKTGSTGVKIQTNLDAAILGADQVAAKPPEANLDRTADGFIWRAGKRIGWIDASTSNYYRIDQVELGADESARPKQGEIGSQVVQGRLADAVAAAEKSK